MTSYTHSGMKELRASPAEGLLTNLRERAGPAVSGSGSARLPEQGPKATCATPTACPKFPESNTSTNPKFLFLREIGVNCLRGFLLGVAQAGPDGPHWGGTLIIDRLVTLTKPLQIPAFFTLAGVGMHGAGRLVFVGPFEGPFKDQPAIPFQENNDKVSGAKSCIRDLAIEGPGSQVLMRGLKVGSQQVVLDDKVTAPRAMGRVQIHNVRVSGFGVYGVQGGMNTYTVLLDCCEFSDNKVKEDNSPGAIRVRPGNNYFTGALNKPSVNTTSGVQVLGNSFERNSVAVKIDDSRALLHRTLTIRALSCVLLATGCDPASATADREETRPREMCPVAPAPRWVLRDKDGVPVKAMVEPRCGITSSAKAFAHCAPLDFGSSSSFPCVRVIDHEGRYVNVQFEVASGQIEPCQGGMETDLSLEWKKDLDAPYLNAKCEGEPFTTDYVDNTAFTKARNLRYAEDGFWTASPAICGIKDAPYWIWDASEQICVVSPSFGTPCVLRRIPDWVAGLLSNPPYTLAVEYD